MIPPGALVLLSPLVVGILFGTRTLAGLLAGALVSGVQMAVSMSNTGAARSLRPTRRLWGQKQGSLALPPHACAAVHLLCALRVRGLRLLLGANRLGA